MTILVRVVANRAQAVLAGLRTSVAGLNSQVAASNAMTPLGSRHITSLMKFGNQIQWTGRMLQYNFTLPIIAAGAAATYFAMEQEKAFTHVAKVYGDVDEAAKQFRREMGLGRKAAKELAESYKIEELEALDEAFTAISEHYGVQKKEVNEVAGAWAAAGSSGLALAESVNETMKAIIIGDMKAADATKALISIQAQYNLSTEELKTTLESLNSIENQTATSMSDLITGFEKAAGVARSAGVETNQLAAYMAALVPATGSASTAGNALKTIMSRLMAPTKETTQILDEMRLSVSSKEWQSATVTERLKILATEFNGLGRSAQNAASSVIASRWQVNRFGVLMREIVSPTGYYAKALEAASHEGENFRRMQHELNTVLESSPRKMQRMMIMLQNASVEIIQPLIPHIIYLAQSLAKMAQGFADLDPHVQKLVLFLVLVLAAIGPVIRYLGALITLFGIFGKAIVTVVHGLIMLAGGLALLFTPFRMLGTVIAGAMGVLSSLVIGVLSGITSVITGAFAAWAAIAVRGWAIQVGIWRAGIALQVINMKLLLGFWRIFMVKLSLAGVTGWAKMWVVMKTITVAALGVHVNILYKFYWFFVRLWATAAIVTTNIWGRMLVGMLLLSKNFLKTLVVGFKAVIPFLVKWGKFLVTPWGLAALAIVGILYTFRDQLTEIWNNIVNYFSGQGDAIGGAFHNIASGIMSAFSRLPQGVQNVMVSIVTIIRDAALAVYDWFSYINPFARHSPSLVENVNNGVKEIVNRFSSFKQIKGSISEAYSEIKRFGKLTANIGISNSQAESKENRRSVRKASRSAGGDGGKALASYDKLVKLSAKLTRQLSQLEKAVDAQQKIVDKWTEKLEKANEEVDKQEKKLARLQGTLDEYQSHLDDAQAALEYYSNAPLVGMRDMENQIFANTMAQNRLRLEMMEMEDVVGNLDDIKSKLEAINGAQELLRGTQSDLRAAGAGSEVLGFYDNEIAKREDQKTAYQESAEELDSMQSQLDKLTREAERLDLVKSLRFDEFTHLIAQAADRTKELSFDEIMDGIAGANAEIDKWTPLVEKATAAVEAQQGVVDDAIAKRDQIQERLEQEQLILDGIKSKYDEVNDAIQAIEQSLNDVVSAAEKMNDAVDKKKDAAKAKKDAAKAKEYVSPGLKNFRDAGDSTFEDPGGMGIPPRTDWKSQAKDIEKFTEKLGMDTASMLADINPFAPLKDKAKAAWNWIKEKVSAVASAVGGFFSKATEGVGLDSDSFNGVKKTFSGILKFITKVASDIGKVLGAAWDLLGPDVIAIGKGIWDGLKDVWNRVGPKLEEFKKLWGPLGKAISNTWESLKPVLLAIVGAFLFLAKIVLSVLATGIKPAIVAIGKVLGGLIDVVRGVIEVVVGILSGDWMLALDGIRDIFAGLFGAIWGIIEGAGKAIWALVWGIVKGIYGFFVWLWDELVGHSIVPDIINGIWSWFEKLIDLAVWVWDNVLNPVFKFFVKAFDLIISVASGLWGGIRGAWNALKNAGQWIWENVLKPVWNWFKSAWSDYIKPALSLWWEGVKQTWNTLKTLGEWFWENILKPVFTKLKELWSLNIKPELALWWERIKAAWNVLLGIGTWVWNNILKPVFSVFKDLWTDHVKPELGLWKERIHLAWDGLLKLGQWITDNVMTPIKNAFTNGWEAIANWFTKNADILSKPISGVVNVVIKAINAMISGLNKVADVLPGVDWNIDSIDLLAKGGKIPTRRTGNGFITNGARAIVGEGKANHPEFVIPTDPTHRNRARALLTMAASKIGMGPGVNPRGAAGDTAGDIAAVMRRNGTVGSDGVPQYSIGGWLSDRWGDVKGVADEISKLPQNAVSGIVSPLISSGRDSINKIGFQPVESPPEFALNKIEAWVKDADKATNKAQSTGDDIVNGGPAARAALAWAKKQAGKPYGWGAVGPSEYDCSGFMSALTNVMLGHDPHRRLGATSNFPWGQFKSGISQKGFTIGSSKNYAGSGIGHMAGTLAGVNVESRGGDGVVVGSAARGYYDSGFETVAKLKMKNGGILKASPGGTIFRGAEAGQDEAVIPLPKDWSNSGFSSGGKTYHFYGDLSFPNITSGDDAELFIQNLENLARD